MTTATDLWDNVKLAYDADILLPMTSIHDRTATSIGASQNTVGTAAAQQCIDYFPLYGEITFDASDSIHNAVAIRGTIAILAERGAISSEMAIQEWDEVFGGNGLLSKLRKVQARGGQGPSSNSNVTQPTGLTSGGARRTPWSQDYPIGSLPPSSQARR